MKRIVVADDDAEIARLIAVNLRIRGYEAVITSDGETAIEACLKEEPDLLVLDLMMPGIDGFEVCRRLRAHPITSDLPILLVTAKTDSDVLRSGIEAGATWCLGKPFDPEDLVSEVARLLAAGDAARKGSPATRRANE